MPEAQTLVVRPRSVLGKKVGRLRREGILPGVVAGGGADSLPIETDTHSFELGYRRWGGTTLLALTGLPGGDVAALIHKVSRHPVNGRLVHVDLQRVSLTQKTHAEVPLHFVGESFAVKTHGAVLLHAMEHINVEAFPQDIPHRVDVDLSALAEVDDAIYLRDLTVDAKIRIIGDLDELVVKTIAARAEEAKPVVAAPAAAAPEAEAAAKPEAGAKAPAPKADTKKG